MDKDADVHARSAELRRRSARLRADLSALQMECVRIRARVDAKRQLLCAESTPAADPHDAAMETLRHIRSIIDPFPLEWQVAIVKALTARTLLKAHEQMRSAPAALSA